MMRYTIRQLQISEEEMREQTDRVSWVEIEDEERIKLHKARLCLRSNLYSSYSY